MSLYIPGMTDEFGNFVQGLAGNFTSLDASIDSINTELGKRVRILRSAYTNSSWEYTFPQNGIFLVVSAGSINSPRYMELVGTWNGALASARIVEVQRATITYEGLKITVNHSGWSYYAVLRLN